MKKYYDIDHDKVYTEDELKTDYETRRSNGELEDFYDTFECYLEACMTRNNGSLEEIAPDYEIENKRRWTAVKIAAQSDMKYENILNVLQKWNVHGTWTMWELSNRPTDYDELQEMVEQELGLR